MADRERCGFRDFRKQLSGYGLTTAEIVYRRPDRHWLLQTYVWQDYDMFPNFPKGFPRVLGKITRRTPVRGHRRALQADQACRTTSRGRSLPAALTRGRSALGRSLSLMRKLLSANLTSSRGPIQPVHSAALMLAGATKRRSSALMMMLTVCATPPRFRMD